MLPSDWLTLLYSAAVNVCVFVFARALSPATEEAVAVSLLVYFGPDSNIPEWIHMKPGTDTRVTRAMIPGSFW